MDRVFTVQGFGTVVTGTMLEGQIEKGQELTVFPEGKTCRVRGIQVYGKEEDICEAGQRAALNLAGLEKEEIRRGCVLAPAGSLKTGRGINVRIKLLEQGQRIVKNQSRLHFYSGTFQMLCRMVLLDTDQLLPGEEGYACLQLDADAALRRGDRFVLRFYSPLETIGGGIVLETDRPREKRFRRETLERLRRKETAGPKELADLLTEERGADLTDLTGLSAELGVSEETAGRIMTDLTETGAVYGLDVNGTEYFLHRKAESRIRKEVLEEIYRYLKQYPYRLGMPEAQLQSGAPGRLKKAADAYISWLVQRHILDSVDCGRIRPAETLSWKPGGRLIAPAGYEPQEDAAYRKVYTVFSKAAEKAGYHFLSLRELNSEVGEKGRADARSAGSRETEEDIMEILRLLELQGKILYLSGDFYTLPELMEQAVRKIREALDREGKITISQVCSLLDTSRKNARLILEYTDRRGITKKEKAESERVKA